MKRMRLKRRVYLFKNKSSIFIIIFLLLIFFIILALKFINLKVNPILLDYAELESRKLSSIIINNAIAKNVEEDISFDELFYITRENGEIKTIDFNPTTVNRLLTRITNSVELNLKYIEKGKIELLNLDEVELVDYDIDKLKKGIIYEIPTGVIFGSSFLANIGPKIPVKFSLVGDIVSYINTKVTDYGINNAVIEINIVLELSEQVILPFTTNKIKIKTSIPVAIKLIEGSVPNYFFNGINRNSNALTVPIE